MQAQKMIWAMENGKGPYGEFYHISD